MVGSARDVVEHCGVPRFLFNDFPLGNPVGHPWQPDMQREVVETALRLLETASGARTTVVSRFAWKDDPGWRERYGRVDPAERDRLIAVGEARRRRQQELKQG
jgi:hypothetical protein